MEKQEEIGMRIKEIRLSRKLTQVALGDLIGLSDKSVSAYEKGSNDLSTLIAAKIAAIGGKSLDWLITGKEANPTTPPPTKEDALRLVLTSDPSFVESIKEELRSQIREETPTFKTVLTKDEEQLLNTFQGLNERQKKIVLETADAFSSSTPKVLIEEETKKEPARQGLRNRELGRGAYNAIKGAGLNGGGGRIDVQPGEEIFVKKSEVERARRLRTIGKRIPRIVQELEKKH